LMKIYYESVGRNALLLLNVPPDTSGRIPAADSLRLMEWRARLDSEFAVDLCRDARFRAPCRPGFPARRLGDGDFDTYWSAPAGLLTPCVEIEFPSERRFDRVVLQEYIPLGQRVCAFAVDAFCADGWQEIASGTTIGYKRILLTTPTSARKLRIRITSSLASPVLSGVGIYQSNEIQ
ncbi:MAG: alpha-L-fucosidase, partial [Bacteroidales bacterium]|nr:alpha-L-fucosidase [Bacteroidales bacterium]